MYRAEILLWGFTTILVNLCISDKYSGYKVYHLYADEAKYSRIHLLEGRPGFDFWMQHNDSVDIMVAPELQSSFQSVLSAMNIIPQMLLNDVQRVLDQQKIYPYFRSRSLPHEYSFDSYLSYDEILKYIDNIAKSHPKMVHVSTFGRTYEGRELRVVRITRCKSICPVIVVEAGIHAREWIAPAMALYVINQLVRNNTEYDFVNLLDWRIIPVLNPDGYEFSRTKDRLWRKTRSEQANNCFGVDANRNFDIHWAETGTSSDPCSSIYHGPEPFSESETRAIRDYIKGLQGAVKLYLSFHSYGNMILIPWSYTKKPPENNDYLRKLAEQARDSMPGMDYRIGSPPEILYSVGGCSTDYMKEHEGINLAFVTEMTKTKWGFFLPTELILPVVSKYYNAVKVFAKALL